MAVGRLVEERVASAVAGGTIAPVTTSFVTQRSRLGQRFTRAITVCRRRSARSAQLLLGDAHRRAQLPSSTRFRAESVAGVCGPDLRHPKQPERPTSARMSVR